MELSEPKLYNAPEGFSEDSAAHFGSSEFAVYEDNRDLNYLEAEFPGCVLHLDLEPVTFHPYVVQIDGAQCFTAVALEAGSTIMDLHPEHPADVLGSEIGHQYPSKRPVDNADPIAVAGTYGHSSAILAGLVESRKIIRIVGEISIHFKGIVIVMVKGPLEAG